MKYPNPSYKKQDEANNYGSVRIATATVIVFPSVGYLDKSFSHRRVQMETGIHIQWSENMFLAGHSKKMSGKILGL